MSSPEVGNITPQSERNYASDYWEVALGTHNIWGYIGEGRPLYMKMNELWQEVLCNVTKIDFTQDITVSRAFQKFPWAARNRVQSMNEHIRVCFLLWPHQIYISIGEKLFRKKVSNRSTTANSIIYLIQMPITINEVDTRFT